MVPIVYPTLLNNTPLASRVRKTNVKEICDVPLMEIFIVEAAPEFVEDGNKKSAYVGGEWVCTGVGDRAFSEDRKAL